jgi:hypothetical protein
MEKKELVEKISIKVSFIYFNLHLMLWFWLGFCFILNLGSSGTFGILVKFTAKSKLMGINLLEKTLNFL